MFKCPFAKTIIHQCYSLNFCRLHKAEVGQLSLVTNLYTEVTVLNDTELPIFGRGVRPSVLRILQHDMPSSHDTCLIKYKNISASILWILFVIVFVFFPSRLSLSNVVCCYWFGRSPKKSFLLEEYCRAIRPYSRRLCRLDSAKIVKPPMC